MNNVYLYPKIRPECNTHVPFGVRAGNECHELLSPSHSQGLILIPVFSNRLIMPRDVLGSRCSCLIVGSPWGSRIDLIDDIVW